MLNHTLELLSPRLLMSYECQREGLPLWKYLFKKWYVEQIVASYGFSHPISRPACYSNGGMNSRKLKCHFMPLFFSEPQLELCILLPCACVPVPGVAVWGPAKRSCFVRHAGNWWSPTQTSEEPRFYKNCKLFILIKNMQINSHSSRYTWHWLN